MPLFLHEYMPKPEKGIKAWFRKKCEKIWWTLFVLWVLCIFAEAVKKADAEKRGSS